VNVRPVELQLKFQYRSGVIDTKPRAIKEKLFLDPNPVSKFFEFDETEQKIVTWQIIGSDGKSKIPPDQIETIG